MIILSSGDEPPTAEETDIMAKVKWVVTLNAHGEPVVLGEFRLLRDAKWALGCHTGDKIKQTYDFGDSKEFNNAHTITRVA